MPGADLFCSSLVNSSSRSGLHDGGPCDDLEFLVRNCPKCLSLQQRQMLLTNRSRVVGIVYVVLLCLIFVDLSWFWFTIVYFSLSWFILIYIISAWFILDDIIGQSLLLPQERKLMGKGKLFEIYLSSDTCYLLFTTTPNILKFAWEYIPIPMYLKELHSYHHISSTNVWKNYFTTISLWSPTN